MLSDTQIRDIKSELECFSVLNQLRQEAIDFYCPLLETFFNDGKKIILADGSFSKEWKKYDHFSSVSRGYPARFDCYLTTGSVHNWITVNFRGSFQLAGSTGSGRGSVDAYAALADVRNGCIVKLYKPQAYKPLPTVDEVVAAIQRLEELAQECKEPYELIRNLKCRTQFRYDFPRD